MNKRLHYYNYYNLHDSEVKNHDVSDWLSYLGVLKSNWIKAAEVQDVDLNGVFI